MSGARSGFHYLGIGCLVAAVVLVVGGSIFGYLAYRWGKNLEADLEDPRGREARVLSTLRGERIPPGYHPIVGLRIPWLLEVAILGDRPIESVEERPDLGERGLVYVAFRDFGRDREELDDFFAGRTDDSSVLERHDIEVYAGKRLTHGRIERRPGPILWVAHEGELGGFRTRGRHEGLLTLFQVRCPDDAYNRIGILFGPPAEGGDSPTLDGTVADAAVVTDFVGHFGFCPE